MSELSELKDLLPKAQAEAKNFQAERLTLQKAFASFLQHLNALELYAEAQVPAPYGGTLSYSPNGGKWEIYVNIDGHRLQVVDARYEHQVIAAERLSALLVEICNNALARAEESRRAVAQVQDLVQEVLAYKLQEF